ncbi:MAG: hypothetical protein HYZ71_15945 [Deltaproteobacteria bacterium]|nr:hypothetical protein [Deltaproteobacteria bacterium]
MSPTRLLIFSIILGFPALSQAVVYETAAGELYHRFGQRPPEEQTIPFSTLVLAAKADIDSISFHQSNEFDCGKRLACERDEGSNHLWLLLRFKDNSVARVELLGVEKRRVDFLYNHSRLESAVTARVITHGPDREPILVRTFASNSPRRPTVQNPELIAKVLGFYSVRVYSGKSKRLSRENHTMVTTAIDVQSVAK